MTRLFKGRLDSQDTQEVRLSKTSCALDDVILTLASLDGSLNLKLILIYEPG